MSELHHLLQNLPSNSVIITPNRRLASSLHTTYQQLQRESGYTSWETPSILPVNVWMETLWNHYSHRTLSPLPHVLNAAQEQQLWERILNESPWHDYFLQIADTSRLVKSARGLLKQWRITTQHPLFDTADDYSAFKHWVAMFEDCCQKNNWIDTASLPDYLLERMIANEISLPANIYYMGFTDLSPQITALMDAAKSMGSHITEITTQTIENKIYRTVANDIDHELRLCAQWAKANFEKNPQQIIGCVIPLLDKKRDRVAQIFNEVFNHQAHFNISAGRPLAQYPVIHAALELLALYKKNIATEDLFFILSTPFLAGGESEAVKRSQFDNRLRSKNFSTLNLQKQTNKDVDEKALSLTRSCPLLAKHIRQFKALLEAAPITNTYAAWGKLFNQLLSALGWPGERILNSEEYQVVEEWLKLLQEMSTLDITAMPVELYQALRTLTQMAGAKPFQPKSPAANIQILGVLEAAGLTYDQLWVSGMDDSNWPSQPKPNPFIPRQLQRELKMPHASAERELEYCLTMTKTFSMSAATVIFSYARNNDKTILQPSPLIKSFTEIPVTDLIHEPITTLSQRIFSQRALEKILDENGPAHQPGDLVRGGVEIIKNQAICPFKAFAECRLLARELEDPLPGLRYKERGTIIHYVMEKCWRELHSHDQLLALTDDALQSILTRIIHEALLEHADAQSHQTGYLKLERNRLLKLATEWLALEKQRPPFIVLNSEKSAEIKLGDLTFTVRIDRIDQLSDGKKLIIDYKTGTNLNVNSWLGERPDEPQLPLYAQLDSIDHAGIAFAQIAAGKYGFKGISQYELEIAGITPAHETRCADKLSWETLTNEWKTVLTKLGGDFYQGKANVDPKDEHRCNHCSIKPFCRIHEDDRIYYDE